MAWYKLVGVVALCATFAGVGVLFYSIDTNPSERQGLSKRSIEGKDVTAPRQNVFDLTMVNYESYPVKVSQTTSVPNGVEVDSYNLIAAPFGTKRQKREDDRIEEWAGGIVDIQPGYQDTAEMLYTNHPAEVYGGSDEKSFHQISAAVRVLQDGIVGGEIFTPNYPDDYPNGADITWTISYTSGYVVRLEVLDYSIEACCDHLMVYDGEQRSRSVLADFQGESVARDSSIVTSTTPSLHLRFTSDCSTTSSGFRASYINVATSSDTTTIPTTSSPNNGSSQTTAVPSVDYRPPQCTGSGTTLYYDGSFASPGFNYPGWYPNNEHCVWYLVAPSGYGIYVEAAFFDTEYTYDEVMIYDGDYTDHNSEVVAIVSGYLSPYTDVVTTQSNVATVVFESDSSITKSGFNINFWYTSISVPTEPPQCGGDMYGDSGVITSPNYPNDYENGLDCTWTVDVSADKYVLFNITHFHTESCCDHLWFYMGTSNTTLTLVEELDGNWYGGTQVLVPSNEAYVRFTTDYSVSYDGFYMTYSAVDPGSEGSGEGSGLFKAEENRVNGPKKLGVDLWEGAKVRPGGKTPKNDN